MTGKFTRQAYQQLVDEDIAWLKKQPRTLEREHILAIVEQSADMYYGPCPGLRVVDAPERSDSVSEEQLTPTEEAIAKSIAAQIMGVKCDRPPASWSCSRAPGHDGPCAASKIGPRPNDARPNPCEHGFYSNEDAHECWRRPETPVVPEDRLVRLRARLNSILTRPTLFSEQIPHWARLAIVEACENSFADEAPPTGSAPPDKKRCAVCGRTDAAAWGTRVGSSDLFCSAACVIERNKTTLKRGATKEGATGK